MYFFCLCCIIIESKWKISAPEVKISEKNSEVNIKVSDNNEGEKKGRFLLSLVYTLSINILI